jgi:hypothetical protein
MRRRAILSGFGLAAVTLSAFAAPRLLARDKHFKISRDDIRPLAMGRGGCIASDRITVEGLPVGFMYRTKPRNDMDSGWAFLSGTEDDAYMNDPANHGIYDVNTIANYDPSIINFLDAPVGSVFEKLPDAPDFVAVTDWTPPGD